MSTKTRNSPRVLVADDDPEVPRSVRQVLEPEGLTAVTAEDGKEAYKLLQDEEPFAAAIFDLMMPHIERRDLVRYMQSERPLMKVPAITMTTEQGSRLSSDSFSAGAVAFLPKPFTDAQLKTMPRMFVEAPKK
ncbi:MAG TPA: response regulator [Pyrinomonadaceae bacterium]|nr:response regulator [Pyrinomonadaceae bacterium]